MNRNYPDLIESAAQAVEEIGEDELEVSEMQKQKHTPGPWRIDCMSASRGLEIKGANGNTVIVEEDYFVFPDEMKNKNAVAEELAANARLIAAAPELLGACQMAVDHLQDAVTKLTGMGLVPNPPKADPLLAVLRAAIAKAEGRAV